MLALYRAQFKTSLAQQLQYRVTMLIWLIGRVLEPVIYLVVWSAVAGATGGSVGGLAAEDFAAYYITLMLVNHLTFTWIMHEFEWRVREGWFSPVLLRPVHPIHADIADNLAYKALTTVVMIPVAVLLALAFKPAFNLSWWAAALFAPALAMAFGVRFLLGWTLAMAAFWVTRVTAINQLFFLAMLFLSGQIAPLTLMPAPLQVAASVLPFRWVAAFPVELLLGQLTPQEALLGLGVQVIWLGLMLFVMSRLWRAAVRQYAAVNG